tara:strand:+ start:4870 stop:5988 length:1119 start_codon:yes stop_codon:yes gene_type:complete
VKHLIDRISEQEPAPLAAPDDRKSNDEDLKRLLESLQPNIAVFGCGGCGSNTVARLTSEGLFARERVKGVAINTDAQHLLRVDVAEKMLIGRSARGRGAGGDPEKGEQAAFESESMLVKEAEGCDLAFITAGLGGGTGTGSAHVLARLCKTAGALTIAIVTYPFSSEGSLRKQNADWGLERLTEVCDTVIVLPNERLLSVEGVRDLPLDAAFRVADELLLQSIRGVSDMIAKEGIVNLDFEDLRSVMTNGGGVAMIGHGEATGGDRIRIATEEALSSPLLDIDVSNARGALINVVGGGDLTLGEAEECANLIGRRIDPHARIIWGATTDPTQQDGYVRVLVVLTGVRSEQIHGSSNRPNIIDARTKSIQFIG